MPIISNDPNHVAELYVQQNTLDARIALHQKYSTNPYGWNRWVFDQIQLAPGMKVLELGCGTGALWSAHRAQVPIDASILLTDFSERMLDAAKAALDDDNRFTFAQMDIQSIPHPDASFDTVIANHMLYHVPDIPKALSEVARVLAPGGCFYASTLGMHSQQELWALYRPFADRAHFTYAKSSPFTLQNGADQLAAHFAHVELREYMDSLLVTEPPDLLDYIKSLQTIPESIAPEFDAHIRAAFAPAGSLHITKEQGLFICRTA